MPSHAPRDHAATDSSRTRVGGGSRPGRGRGLRMGGGPGAGGGPRRVGRLLGAGFAAVALLATSACSSSGNDSGGDKLSVVASTNVWGDIVAQVGGDLVEVTSIVDDPSADPHSYEASARTQLAISRAGLVVANGGGYDDFVDTMVAALDEPPVVLHAVDLAATGEENEHVWYSLPAVTAVADEVAAELGALDPANAATYTDNAVAFGAQIDGLLEQVSDVRGAVEGRPVAITEPVPAYLLADLGLEDVTPAEFSEAIEEETDVPPAVLAETLALFAEGRADALVYNEQTTGPQTEQVLAEARAADVPVVPVRETLPPGVDYVEWMASTIDAIREALAA